MGLRHRPRGRPNLTPATVITSGHLKLRVKPLLLSGLVGLLAASVVGCSASDTEPPDVRDSSAPFVIEQWPAGASGSLVAARGDEQVTCQGRGLADRARDIEADCDTAYDVMSMTKQFTAAAILKLRQQDRLSVSDRIGAHVDGVPADKRGITVEQLLTHTSGLVDTLGGDYEPLDRADFVAAALRSELQSPPGSTHLYSNVGYSLLAVIIEEVSGMSYERYLADHLFGPAGMHDTGYVLPQWENDQLAVEYDRRGVAQGRPTDHPWAADGPYWNLRGNGGLISTAHDLFRWHLALAGHTVLDADAKRQLFRARVPEEPGGDAFASFGWVVLEAKGEQIAWHNGGNGWSYGEIARTPDGSAMVFWVTNQVRSDTYNLEAVGAEITESVLRRLL